MEKLKKRRVVAGDFFREVEFKRYFFWAIVAVLLILSYLVIRSYLVALISAFILAFLVKPVHVRLKKRVGNRISALLSVLLVLIIILVPIALLLGSIAQQMNVYFADGGFADLLEKVSSIPLLSEFGLDLEIFAELGGEISLSPIASFLTSAISHIPGFIVSVFITLFGMYFILVGWDDLAISLKRYIPFKNKNEVTREISEITNTIVYGTFFMALIEFVVAALGFYILGVKFYLLLAVLVFFFAFIPAIGPAFVWVPTAIYYFAVQNYYAAVGALVLGLILSVVIDTILRAKVLGDKSKINPLVMIVGILGGISVFGIFGFIIGPLVLLYTIEILQEVMSRN